MTNQLVIGLLLFIGLIAAVWLFVYPDSDLPSSGLAGQILDMLQDGDMSGYELMKALREKNPSIPFKWDGMIYGTLHMLEDLNRIEGYWRGVPIGVRRSRVYRIKRKVQ